jgi:hypothetical protein
MPFCAMSTMNQDRENRIMPRLADAGTSSAYRFRLQKFPPGEYLLEMAHPAGEL